MYDEKGLEEPPILGGRIYHIGYTLDYSSKRKTEICDPVYFSYRTYVGMGKPIKIRIERTDKVYPVISHH